MAATAYVLMNVEPVKHRAVFEQLKIIEEGSHAQEVHIAQYLMHGPTYHSIAMWRHPRTDRSYDWRRPELYQHIARVCERGKLDMVFFADFNYIFDAYQNAPDTALRYATQTPMHDPVPLLSWMAAVTLPNRPRLHSGGE